MNAAVLFTTRYRNAALDQPRAGGHEVREEDVARLSPFVRHHIDTYLDTPRSSGADRHCRMLRIDQLGTAVQLSRAEPIRMAPPHSPTPPVT